ncbi:MAG: glycosyltransferase 87 family protein [Candidatus Limnocylindria bacterium]
MSDLRARSTWRRDSIGLFVVATLYLVAGLAMAAFLVDSTAVGADLGTYQRASRDLWDSGNPYLSAATVSEDFRYRYPPLLAMLRPLVDFAPAWYAILVVASAVPIWLAVHSRGWIGVLPALLLVGPWGQQLLNGNAQAIVIALMALVPLSPRAGAVGLAVAAMLKLHPALGVVWYIGRRQWGSVAWFAGATVVLLLVQVPWLPDFFGYYLTDTTATTTVAGLSLRAFGTPIWIIGLAVVGYLSYRYANGRWGWLLNVVWQLVALPRVLLVNLALLLAAPFPRRPSIPASDAVERRARRPLF